MEKGVPIRSVSRALAVLMSVNRKGAQTMMDIARSNAIAYPTACRIVQTLMHEGMLEREVGERQPRRNHLLGAVGRDAGQPVAGARRGRLGEQVAQIIELIRGGIDRLAIDHAGSATILTFNGDSQQRCLVESFRGRT